LAADPYAAAARTTEPGAAKLSFKTKAMYGLGQAAEGIKNYAFESFLFFYYNQVLGLSGKLTGLALLLTLMCDAVMDPLAGSASDNLKHRWGRRHPFMYASAVPLAITFALIFSAPQGSSQTVLFAWLTVTSILVRAAMALYHVPHLALGAELSSDYNERTAVVGYRLLFAVLGSILLVIGAWRIFFRPSPEFTNGQLDPSVYPGLGITFGVLIMLAILVSSYGTHDRIPYLAEPPDKPEPFGLGRVFRELVGALRNRSFLFLFIGIVIFFVMRGVQVSLGLHVFTFFWLLEPKRIEGVQLAMVLAFAFGVPIWTVLSRRLDKRTMLVIALMCFSIFNLIPPMAAVSGAWPEVGSQASFAWLSACMALAAFGGAGGFIAGGSMLADVADEHELLTRRRQEGIFFGALSFAGKSAAGLGILIAGAATDLIGFPTQAKVGQVPESTLDALAIVYGPGIVFLALLAQPFIWRYRLTRTRHAEIVRELELRRGKT
jgi:glycoside/pentoside/hexuronide:cation symporter, GPH family